MERHQAGYGQGIVEIEDAELQALDELDNLRGKLIEFFNSDAYVPPNLPVVAMELQRLSRKTDVQYEDIVALLSQDPILAARTLKIAQSALYATRFPPQTLLDAVSRLGLKNVQDMVWQSAMTEKVFRATAYKQPMESLRRHAVATAHLSALTASYTGLAEEQAFLAGLLHDVGLAAALIVLSELPSFVRDGELVSIDLVAPTLEVMHEELGEVVAQAWELPMDIRLVIAHHHLPKIQGYDHPLAATVAVAQELAIELGAKIELGCVDIDHVRPTIIEHAYGVLGLNEKQRALIRSKGEELLAKL